MESDTEETVGVGKAEFLKETPSGKAAVFNLYDHGGKEVCLPMSCIITELPAPGELIPDLEITAWIAGEKGLAGSAAATTPEERQTGAQRTADRAITPVRENTRALGKLAEHCKSLEAEIARTTRAMGKFCRVLSSVIAAMPKADQDKLMDELREVPKALKAPEKPAAPANEEVGDAPGDDVEGGPDSDPAVPF